MSRLQLALVHFVFGLSCILLPSPASAEEIGFIEDFSLAEDRTQALAQLIPGTEDYYYYHALHYQNNEQFDKVEELLKAWIKRYNYTARVQEIRYRQALLTYDQHPAQSLEFVRQELGIQFNHQREIVGRKPNLPTQLNPQLIDRKTLTQQALARHRNTDGFEHRALDWLIASELDPDRRRHLLGRLDRPDHANLPKLIVDDLNHRSSRGFGSLNIHRQLLLTQLDECLRLQSNLLNQTNFVNIYLSKLQPTGDVEWQHDDKAYAAYLARLWKFAKRLAPVHNSLKAHIVYHQLEHNRSRGIYDQELFMTYIRLPRNVSYINADYMKLDENRRYTVNLNQDFRATTLLTPIGNDEPLVRSYLHHFFVDENTFKPYEPYINDIYLKHNFAETKIVNGLGEPEQWYSMLPPAQYQQLKERIDLDFAFTNQQIFAADDPVQFDLHIKHVPSLIVKVYEINTQNYYREKGREVNTDINLDGLVANSEKTYQYADPPLRRVTRHFEFPELKRRGVYVIDFIGNGKSSRVVVRKGGLRYLARTSTAGQIFTILDDQNQIIKDATLWMAGHEYQPSEDGTIVTPFSTQPGRQTIVLSQGDFSDLQHFQHESENYQLKAGIYVDREALLSRNQAQVLIRPGLYLNGIPVSLELLEDVELVITSTDSDGIVTTREEKNFPLYEDREATFDFQVPRRLANIQFQLQGKVKNLSQNKKVNVAFADSFALNGIDRTEKLENLHLLSYNGLHAIELLGRTGEPIVDRAVQLSIKHRDFKQPVTATLKTDLAGRVSLGALPQITSVTARGPEGTSQTWQLLRDETSGLQTLQGLSTRTMQIPFMSRRGEPTRDELSLLEVRGESFVADRFGALSVKNGLLNVGKLAAGDYDLLDKTSLRRIRLRITDGEAEAGYALGQLRLLEVRGEKPLQIQAVTANEDAVEIQLQNVSKFARVHVFATRYHPAYHAFARLDRVHDIEPLRMLYPAQPSMYAAGRKIGDEYQYIINRRLAHRFPGNMLQRPELLLNPWAIRNTETGNQDAAAGDMFAPSEDAAENAAKRDGNSNGGNREQTEFANLDFLADASTVLINLVPNKQGVITFKRDALGTHQQLHVVAIDPRSTVYRSLELGEQKARIRDLRLANGLPPLEHFTQQKQITLVAAGKSFEMQDITSSKFESYDTLARVYSLYTTLSTDAKLIEFSFILNWHKLTDAEKQEKYSQYACHELNFFLLKKDPAFFQAVIQDYLTHKKDKTFLDHWLTEADLKAYVKPWKYQQLNIVERALLAQRLPGERKNTARHVHDLFQLIPPNVDQFNQLFNTAVKTSALDIDGDGASIDMASQLQKLSDKASEFRANTESLSRNGPAQPQGASSRPDNAKTPAPNASIVTEVDLFADSDEATDAIAKPKSRAQKRQKKNAQGRYEAGEEEQSATAYFADDRLQSAKKLRQLYRKLDKTKEWVENNYYQLPIERQNAGLVTANAFWADYAAHDPNKPFYSVHLAEASRNFTEMMFALSVLDIPFEAKEHKTEFDNAKMDISAGSPMIVFHEEIRPAANVAEQTPILVSQNFFRHGDRYRHVNNQRLDKYVTDEFLVHVAYGCQVVVTNPTSSPRRLNLLLQVPTGAIPVMNGQMTRTVNMDLQPYNTQTVEYYFYFPAPGKYEHYPVHVASNEEVLAFAEPFVFQVVEELSKIDTESWDYVSQNGSPEDVLQYLKNNNLHRTQLDRIAWRMQNKSYFEKVISLLSTRHAYDHTLWSYGIRHDVPVAIQEYLQHADGFLNRCGLALDSPLVTIDPVVRKTYQHMEYKPLVNARAHQLGRRRQILNDRFYAQYHRLMKVLSYQRKLKNEDRLAVAYYMLLQDRVADGLKFYGQVNANGLATQMQYDYMTAYLSFFAEDQQIARDLTEKYADHPVDRWRNAFASIRTQLDEIEGQDNVVVDDENRTEQQTNLAATAPSFDFKVEAKQIRLEHQNLKSVRVNYYLMDIELLFSRNPFVQQYSGQFSYIRPNGSVTLDLAPNENTTTIELPQDLHTSNVLVEIVGAGQTKTQAYYSNSLALQVIENYGQVRVAHADTRKPISKAYVKVYARLKDGRIRFYKDGYTDLRGRFDYTSLNTNELDFVDKFSLLIMSDENGAVVREANPPKR